MREDKIHPKMKVAELLQQWPKLHQVFQKLKMDCPKCKGSVNESLAQVAQMYGKKPEELIQILENFLKKDQ